MTALGFRVKSGFAVGVVLSGPVDAPEAVARRIVELSDRDEPRTKQPYHDGFYRTEEDAAEIARRVKIVRRCAKRSIAALVDDLQRGVPGRSSLNSLTSEGRPTTNPRRAHATHTRSAPATIPRSAPAVARRSTVPLRAALVVGSVIDPAKVGNPHIRAHAH